MDLIDNSNQCKAICINLKVPSTFRKSYYIMRLKTVRTKDDINYLEPEKNIG